MNKKFIVFLSSRKSWTLPYIIFSAIFVVIPLVLIVVYAFTDDNGHLTLANFQKFFEHPEAINTFVYSIYGIDEGIDSFGMFEEFLKIGECQMTVIIGKRIHDN